MSLLCFLGTNPDFVFWDCQIDPFVGNNCKSAIPVRVRGLQAIHEPVPRVANMQTHS